MFVLVDTCFWTHSLELAEQTIWDVRDAISLYRWGYTSEVLEEILHFQLDRFIPVDQAIIVPASQAEVTDLIDMDPFLAELDQADITLIAAARREGALVFSDDVPLVLECKHRGISALRLPTFLLSLVADGFVKKTIMNRCITFWEGKGRYKKSDLKKWKGALASIR